jgi:hypothetical protein
VSLSPEEFREHLKLSSATAGLTLPDLALPAAHHVILRGMRFHYLDWGTRGLPPSATAWRSTSGAMATASGRR